MAETLSADSPDDDFVYNLSDIFQEFSENESEHLELKREIIAAGEELLHLLRSYDLDLGFNSYEIHYFKGFHKNLDEIIALQNELQTVQPDMESRLLQTIINTLHLARIFSKAGYKDEADWYFDEAYLFADTIYDISEKADALRALIVVEQLLQ